MDTPHVRRCIDISRKKILLIALLGSLLAVKAQGQTAMRYRRVHLENYDDRPLRYGFFFALPSTRFNVKYSDAYMTADSAYQLFSPNRTGFRVGFVLNALLSDHFDLRTTPSVSLYGREVIYRYAGGTERKEVRESTWLEIPLLLKYKSQRRHNSRMYVIGGLSLGLEANVRKGESQGSSRLLTKTRDLSVEYGIGFEQFFEFFKFAPELRFSHGLVNLFEPVQVSTANQSIRGLNTHTVTLFLTFE